jgi:hypothetical protein
MQPRNMPRQRGHVTGHILGVQHAADQMRFPLRHPRQRRRHCLGPSRIMAAVQPQLNLRGRVHQRTLPQALHPGGPEGAGDGSFARRLIPAQMAQGGNRGPGVLNLMGSGQVR